MDAPSKPLFTLMTEIAEPSLACLSKPETMAKKCMKNESCKSTSMYNRCKPMRIRVKACRKIPPDRDGSPDQDALVARRSCVRASKSPVNDNGLGAQERQGATSLRNPWDFPGARQTSKSYQPP